MRCGIPQGSILGPLFFLLYINDLPESLQQTTPRLFADDTNLTASGGTIEELESVMNSDLKLVKEWLLANKLNLNVAKTEFILIGSHYNLRNLHAQPEINIGQNHIKQVTHSKVLGVEIDQFLSWHEHTDKIAKKVTSGLGAIKRIREFVDKKTLINVHNALVQPHFDYCSVVWDTLGESLSKRLQKLQNRSARLIMSMNNDTPHEVALNALGWKPLLVQRKEAKSKQMFKLLNGMAPSCLSDIFTKKQDVTKYSLRGLSTSLQLPLPKTENGKRSFSYDGPKVWNSLPEHIQKAKSLNEFKSKIAAFLNN